MDANENIPVDGSSPLHPDGTVVARSRFGLGRSALGGWGIPLTSLGGRDDRYAWWRVLELFRPFHGAQRTGAGKYAAGGDGAAWEARLNFLVDELESVGFTVQDYYSLCLTLERLSDDQWARVDKRLFAGEGVKTRSGWKIAPTPQKWAAWSRLVHEEGMLPHEATDRVLGGVWPWTIGSPDFGGARR